MRRAVVFYTQALACASGCVTSNAVYLANRSAAQLLLGNWGRALCDGRDALALDPRNVKSAFRAAKAAAALGRHADVVQLCDAGLQGERAAPAHLSP